MYRCPVVRASLLVLAIQLSLNPTVFSQELFPVTTQQSSTRICRDSTVSSIGFNYAGSFGDGTDGAIAPPSKANLLGRSVCVVADDQSSVASVSSDGSVSIWGVWGPGKLGIAGLPTVFYEPKPLSFVQNVLDLSLGDRHVLFVNRDSTLSVSGSNDRGQLGQGHTDPIEIGAVAVALVGVVAAEAGVDVSLALTSDGTLYGWGYNGSHTISASETELYLDPTPVHPELGPWKSFSLASGLNSIGIVIAVNEAGEVYVWGGRAFYVGLDNQLGSIVDPIELEQFRGVTAAVSIAANHCLVLTSTGQVYAAGVNSSGELGQGHLNRITGFHHVEGLIDIVDVHADYKSSFALGSNQSVWCWGSNTSSRLVMERDDLFLSNPTLLPEYCSTVGVDYSSVRANEDHIVTIHGGLLEHGFESELVENCGVLFDILGHELNIRVSVVGQSVQADISSLPTGLYFLVVRKVGGQSEILRILVDS